MPTPSYGTIDVQLGGRSYGIDTGAGTLDSTERIVPYLASRRVALVTNDTLWPLHAAALARRLIATGIEVIPVVLPDGEAHKDWASLEKIFATLLAAACDRQTTVLALGGGVVGDLAGFAAATYQRGVPYIQVPTTLLAMVDSSVGGKTAINHALGKNMIGAFYQPVRVVIDTHLLSTLPEREFRSGLSEIIKYGLIADGDFFSRLESNLESIMRRDPESLVCAIRRSCEIKAQIVSADERETAADGGRALLNLGHTFGHAIEAALGYGHWLHGEAVACGINLAARYSFAHGLMERQEAERCSDLIKRTGLPMQAPNVTADELLEHMRRDKKNLGGNIRLILLTRIGQALIRSEAQAPLREFLAQQLRTVPTPAVTARQLQ